MNAYEESIKVYRDNYSVLKSATQEGLKKGIEKGIKQGIKQGIEKGIKQGIKKGKEEGLKEGASKREQEIAARLKKKGVPTEVIAETTGLSKEQIENL